MSVKMMGPEVMGLSKLCRQVPWDPRTQASSSAHVGRRSHPCFEKMLSRGCGSFCSLKKLFPGVFAGVTRAKHTLPDLPYDYNALEPTISAEIMQIHHQKHHATYVNNLNVAEEKFAEAQAKGYSNSL